MSRVVCRGRKITTDDADPERNAEDARAFGATLPLETGRLWSSLPWASRRGSDAQAADAQSLEYTVVAQRPQTETGLAATLGCELS